MARGASTEVFGLAANAALVLKSFSPNPACAVFEDVNELGDNIVIETYAEKTAPTADYAIALGESFDATAITLGTLTAGNVVITGMTIKTAAGSAPVVTVSGGSVPAGGTEGKTFTTPAQTVGSEFKAQILFGAFTYSGAGCHLSDCTATLSCTFGEDAGGDGETCAWDVYNGMIEVTATFKKTGSTALTLAAASGWVMTVKPATGGVMDESAEASESTTATFKKALATVLPA